MKSRSEYNRLQWKVEEMQALAERVTKAFSLVPASRGSKKHKDDAYASLIEYKELCEWKLEELIKESMELEGEIDRAVTDEKTRVMLKYRFVDSLTVKEIAERTFLSERTVSRMIGRGRQQYEGVYGDSPYARQ